MENDPLLVRLREILQRQLAPLGKIGKFPALEAELRALLAEVAIDAYGPAPDHKPDECMHCRKIAAICARFGVQEKP